MERAGLNFAAGDSYRAAWRADSPRRQEIASAVLLSVATIRPVGVADRRGEISGRGV